MVWSPEFEFDIDLLPQQRVDALP
ncbi:hypothethical protein (plasmid) [Ralstonia solanacearum CMR15]|nr:hypothethical protein [Ralstonia solanacearum CMR15]